MEPSKIPLIEMLDGLVGDLHHCDKELFAYIKRTLNNHGMYCLVKEVDPDMVHFLVERD